MSVNASVRIKAADGVWETVGVDRLSGISPGNIRLTADRYGAQLCSFDLKREPGSLQPDLGAFTECEVEIGGSLVWSGRIYETPTRGGADPGLTVSCRGWQYHLDDDVVEKFYVHARLNDWRDLRSHPQSPTTGGFQFSEITVQVGNGAIMFGAPVNNADPAFSWSNVQSPAFLDCGGGDGLSSASAINLTVVGGGGSVTSGVVYATNEIGNFTTGHTTTFKAAPLLTTPTNYYVAFNKAYRYVWIYAKFNGVVGINDWMKVTGATVYGKTSYADPSTKQSVLRASDVVKDILPTAIFLDQSQARILNSTTFAIPHYVSEGQKSPREIIEAVNSFHQWNVKVNPERELVYEPQPGDARFEVGKWSGTQFDDQSANSAEEIYNAVVVQATGADGQPFATRRDIFNISSDTIETSTQTPGGTQVNATPPTSDTTQVLASTQLPNRLFEGSHGATIPNWNVNGGPFTFVTSPAGQVYQGSSSGRLTTTDPQASATYLLSGFSPGQAYTMQCYAKAGSVGTLRIRNDTGGSIIAQTSVRGGSGFEKYTLIFTPPNDRINIEILVVGEDNSFTIDQVNFLTNQTTGTPGSPGGVTGGGSSTGSTQIGKRGGWRARVFDVSAAVTREAAHRIGDQYLASAQRTPFRGTLTVWPGGVREVQGGAPVHPSELLRQTGQLLRFSNLVDPDSGGHGRDGHIAEVSYDHDAQQSVLSIDNTRSSLEALLARLAVVNNR